MEYNLLAMNVNAAGATPPAGMLAKLSFYRRKYGLLHAVGSYAGRISPSFWRLAGSTITRNYLRRWTETAETRIVNLGGGSHCLVGSSRVDLQACKLEYSIVSPK